MGAVPQTPLVLHATCVAVGPRAVLIRGASGSGKSGLGLQLMALGATLVSDDRTILTVEDGALIARAPDAIAGLIEARGMGLLRAKARLQARVALVVDLDRTATDRMPKRQGIEILGVDLPLFEKVDSPYFPAAILQYLSHDQEDAV